MLRWLGNTLGSTIGKKLVMGLTGFLLVGFLIEHLVGNLTLFQDSDGQAFNDYVAYLMGFGPVLLVAEVGLAALFLCHIYLAFRLTLENREARKGGYVIRSDRGGKTFGSASMFVTGALVLAYILKHLYDFRFDGRFKDDPASLVKSTLAQPGTAFIYLGALVALAIHLSHGFQSAFQSLGFNHPRYTPCLRATAIAVGVLFALGFAAFPIYFCFFWTDGANG